VRDEVLATIVADYTREAGVRGLERQLATLLRKVAARVAEQPSVRDPGIPARGERDRDVVTIDDAAVRDALGRSRFFPEVAAAVATPGVATGLAVTGSGGDVLFVEASSMPGEAGLVLTGQLGDVMKESAQIALSYVQAHAGELGIDERAAARVHLHVPAGAIPKDGPSAGVTMTTALVSLLTGRAVRPDVGMTGEVTLQGRVLPIGGVKQKVLAAQRAGLRTVVLPARNGPDLDDVPASVRDQLTFVLADHISEVLEVALAA
jgi:ATP-dependent Lon protease